MFTRPQAQSGSLLGTSGEPGHKQFSNGTHRSRDPAETLKWIAPMLTKMGITRVANITGLDRIGVPVTMVTRPQSRSLAVSQGKGLNLLNARVSGIMESVETFHAERIEQPLVLSNENSLSRTVRVSDVARMAKSGEQQYHPEQRLLWIEALDLISGEPLWVPYESVHSDFTLPRPAGSGFFPANTNGLASGNMPVEAVKHALCEVIERDAIALWQIRPSKQRRCIALESIDDQKAQHLLELLNRAGLDVRIWDASSDIGVACIHCLLMEQNNGERNMQFADPEFGSGCHPDRSIALLRAVTEAIQARTTFIAGSRDDFQTKDYQSEARASRRNACLLLMQGNDCAVPFASVPHQHFDTLAEDVQWLLEQLMKVGIKEVPCLDLQLEQFNIPVARVIVPGLEGANNGNPDDYEPGARAKALVESQLSQPA